MDAISYSYADKQAKRIKKFNENPDSASGIVTQPSIIQTGEVVTIPVGRTAVMAHTVINGTVKIDGTMFIPSGATTTDIDTKLSTKIDKVISTDNAIVRFDGTTGAVQNSAVTVDDSGNIGIGVTPSASVLPTIQSQYNFIAGNDESNLSTNAYYSVGGVFKYIANGYVVSYIQQKSGGSHTWRTAPSGTAGNPITWTNAMTLSSSGNLQVGTIADTVNPIQGVTINNSSGVVGNIGIGHASGVATSSTYLNFLYNGTTIGYINQVGTTAVAYNTTSDYRLKENIRPSDCKRFMDIKFVDYERVDGMHECGVIAHELQEVYPDLVTGKKDAVEIRKIELTQTIEEVKDEDGNVITEAIEATYEEQEFPVYQQVNYMGLIARIGTVVQQQAKLIEAMQLEINELKGAI